MGVHRRRDRPSTVRVRRTVWAESDTLDSPLHYEVDVTGEIDGVNASAGAGGVPRNQHRVFDVLRDWTSPLATAEVHDAVANDGLGVPPKTTTIRRLLNELADKGLADGEDDGEGTAKRWWRL